MLAVVGTGAATTGVVGGDDTPQVTDGGYELDSDRIQIRICDCYTATVRTQNPAAEVVTAGLYFHETDCYDFHQTRAEFPYELDLREFDWACEQGAVLTDVTVEDIDFTALAEASVPDAWGCEEGDVEFDRDCSDDA
ncbi:hypothetical protein C477_02769 [Haloterrigena salina JCM 13891]|uniref:Uncharacterized protein n=1 Tax=Haloterrigena salina JCM 13891 TaxID=1227488 RepID=M0CLB8_9EURY|nr:hypothetical protein [Haloterrigena salina]ELZ23433.1 hypothetical protein C477_02769 [Haloterrigena salina JCM 13891]